MLKREVKPTSCYEYWVHLSRVLDETEHKDESGEAAAEVPEGMWITEAREEDVDEVRCFSLELALPQRSAPGPLLNWADETRRMIPTTDPLNERGRPSTIVHHIPPTSLDGSIRRKLVSPFLRSRNRLLRARAEPSHRQDRTRRLMLHAPGRLSRHTIRFA